MGRPKVLMLVPFNPMLGKAIEDGIRHFCKEIQVTSPSPIPQGIEDIRTKLVELKYDFGVLEILPCFNIASDIMLEMLESLPISVRQRIIGIEITEISPPFHELGFIEIIRADFNRTLTREVIRIVQKRTKAQSS